MLQRTPDGSAPTAASPGAAYTSAKSAKPDDKADDGADDGAIDRAKKKLMSAQGGVGGARASVLQAGNFEVTAAEAGELNSLYESLRERASTVTDMPAISVPEAAPAFFDGRPGPVPTPPPGVWPVAIAAILRVLAAVGAAIASFVAGLTLAKVAIILLIIIAVIALIWLIIYLIDRIAAKPVPRVQVPRGGPKGNPRGEPRGRPRDRPRDRPREDPRERPWDPPIPDGPDDPPRPIGCREANPHAMFCDPKESDREAVIKRKFPDKQLGECRPKSAFGSGRILDCDGAPGETWHCTVNGIKDYLSVFACTCCDNNDAGGINWRNPHVSVKLGR